MRWADMRVMPDEDAPRRTAAALVAANLVPLAGVIFLGWSVAMIVLLYWIENLVIGAMNVLRIAYAQGDAAVPDPATGKPVAPVKRALSKLAMMAFFGLHFGAFCYGHGTFLVGMFGGREADGPGDLVDRVRGLVAEPGLLLSVAALIASHFYSFLRNYLGRGEYRHVDADTLMTRPYGRIVVVQVFIIVGGIAVSYVNSPIVAMLVFVVAKILIDVHMHERERRLLGGKGRA